LVRPGAEDAKAIPRKQFLGTDAEFAALYRNKDGAISPSDLDWSDRSPEIQMVTVAILMDGNLTS
jgi:hypothetical protein